MIAAEEEEWEARKARERGSHAATGSDQVRPFEQSSEKAKAAGGV